MWILRGLGIGLVMGAVALLVTIFGRWLSEVSVPLCLVVFGGIVLGGCLWVGWKTK